MIAMILTGHPNHSNHKNQKNHSSDNLQFFYKKKRLSALKRLTCCIFRLFLIFVTQKLLES
jgi:hypothetical protein